jgi:glycosyltransferase involved in cell wall biosynthesis
MKNALVCRYGSSGELAASIVRLLEDDALRRRLGENALETARSRGWDSVMKDLMEQYAAACGRGQVHLLERSAQ